MAPPARTPDETVRALELVLERARAYVTTLDDDRVRMPNAEAASHRFRGPLPDDGDGTLAVIARLFDEGLDAHVRSSGPRFFHWVIGGATPAARAADWITSVFDQNAGGWDASPLATELESVALSWLRELFELPAAWQGVLTTGATMANFTGLAAGRRWWGEQHGVDVEQEGLAALPPVPVLSSGFLHTSTHKALAMLGIGRGSVTTCAVERGGRMDVELLELRLRELDGAPAIVIANAGEVNAGQFDPVEEIADVVADRRVWLHVDGAFGLFARITPRARHLTEGVERADSVIADGHKWLNVPFDCGFAFVRDADLLAGTFTAGADYLPSSQEERPIFGFLGPELSRRARAFTVWATLAAYGRSGYRSIVERNLDHAARLAAQVEDAPDFELLAPAPLNIVCFRYRPDADLEDEALDELNLAVEEQVLPDGRIYVGTTRFAGRVAFRPAFVNWRTRDEDIDLVLPVLRELGERVLSQRHPARRTTRVA